MKTIDLNSDLGESFGSWKMGDDKTMLSLVTSANIACGFHAGDPMVMRQTVQTAHENGVRIGAHVAYPDLVGFGRRYMDMTQYELTSTVLYQLGALQGIARSVGAQVSYLKPHGALYNTIAKDQYQAQAVFAAIKLYDPTLPIMIMPNTPIVQWAQDESINFIYEVFADRAYNDDGTLVSRRLEGAVLHDHQQVAQRMFTLVTEGYVDSINGQRLNIPSESICVHGDSPEAVGMTQAIVAKFKAEGIALKN